LKNSELEDKNVKGIVVFAVLALAAQMVVAAEMALLINKNKDGVAIEGY
jgi:hypothetical protein